MTLHADQLVALATDAVGCDDFGDPRWREGLDVLIESANSEAALNPIGTQILSDWIGERLRNRLRVMQWVGAHPTVRDEQVAAPFVVVGMLRTGTTILAELLAADPANRPLMKWEGLDSIPPPTTAQFATDPRVAREVARQEAVYSMVPALKAIHWEPGDGPTECVALLTQSFRAQDFTGLFHVPSYLDWFQRCDMATAYEYHRLSLQVLQSSCPGRWSLKAPGHLLALDAMLAVYPDARVIVTHRDPIKTVGSSASLSVTSRPDSLTTDGFGANDAATYFGRMWLNSLGEMTDRLMEVRDRRGDGSFHDVHFTEFVKDPIATVAAIYEAFGDTLSPEAESAMRAHLDGHQQGRFGAHRYSLDQFGLDEAQINERFSRYNERFAIVPEESTR